ncbi:hypothetical protein LTR86_007718 [Recurvomyces mirabilis]|nr:hypothetical protein LTR86_007718 [Recurvomyces mirabilis]
MARTWRIFTGGAVDLTELGMHAEAEVDDSPQLSAHPPLYNISQRLHQHESLCQGRYTCPIMIMTDTYRHHEPEFRDDILTLKDNFTVAISKEPRIIEWVLLDGGNMPVWWRYANGDLEHELQPATSQDEIALVLATGDWQHIPISEDTKQHRERMLFTYGSQPAVEPYNEITTLEFIEQPDPNLVLPIFRLYDLTKDSIDEYGDESKATYIALSHV